jgi:ABC-type nitrate/sulfonate/bicarbonate transport system substrate-binding protein
MPTSPPCIAHMPMVIAQALGLNKIHGINVTPVALNGGVNVFRAMLAGHLDVGMSPVTVKIIAAVL